MESTAKLIVLLSGFVILASAAHLKLKQSVPTEAAIENPDASTPSGGCSPPDDCTDTKTKECSDGTELCVGKIFVLRKTKVEEEHHIDEDFFRKR
ncbi:hypothetical protein Ahia01_000772400 [Argonauta hians]